MSYGFDDYVHLSPVGLAELSIHRAMATIQGQVSLPGFQSDYERASQAIVQIAGPEFAAARWVNPIGVEMMGARSLSEAMQRLDMFVNSNLVGTMQRAMDGPRHMPIQFSARAMSSEESSVPASLFVTGTISTDKQNDRGRVIMAMIDDSAVARHMPSNMERTGRWTMHPGAAAVQWSPEAYSLLGFSPTGGLLNGDDLAGCFLNGDREQFRRLVESLSRTKSSAAVEIRAVGSDGFRRSLRIHAESQTSGRIDGTIDDITPYRLSSANNAPNLQRLTQVLSVLRRIEASLDMPSLTRLVTAKVRELTGADGATFVVRRDDRVVYLDENAVKPLWKGQDFDITNCISGWSMLYESPAVIPDIYADERIPIEFYRPTFVQSMVMVPVRCKGPGLAIGAYFAKKYAATLEDLAVLRAIADSACRAMEGMEQA